ncbi:MAG: hypothetical protein WCJ09_08235, partial [Planctomycetota bacterium]
KNENARKQQIPGGRRILLLPGRSVDWISMGCTASLRNPAPSSTTSACAACIHAVGEVVTSRLNRDKCG